MKLKAGDIRQEGDQFRETELGPVRGCYENNGWTDKQTKMQGPGMFEPVRELLGEPILQSDLMHLEFIR